MLRQSTSQTFMLTLLTVLLPLCSLSAFSGTRKMQILHKIGTDTDTYVVAAKSAGAKCVDHVWPWFVDVAPGNENEPPIINIRYLSSVDGCALYWSIQPFVVRSKEHPERIARFWWLKGLGTSPYASPSPSAGGYGWDRHGLLSFDNSDGDNIKVWIGRDGLSQ